MKNIIKDVSGDKKEALRVDGIGYKTLLENLPQKIFCKDRNSVYVFCNKNYAQDLGIRAEEIVGRTDYDFYPKELAEKYRADDKRIMAAGKVEDLEEKYIRKGEEMIVHTVKTPVRGAQGSVIGILGIFWDVTRQKKMEEVTKESAERFRLLFESSIDAIFMADAKTKMLVDCNKNAEKLVGRSRAEILSMSADALHPSDRVKETMEAFGGFAKAKIKYTETEVLTKSGERIPVEISGSPFIFKGKPYLIGIFRDISERKRAEEELRIRAEKLERMNKLMVGRELRMAELKKEIKEPKRKSGETGQ